MPFLIASAAHSNNSEPPPPTYARPYGFNLLLLVYNNTTALDIPSSDRIESVQQLLALGESWNITANVSAMVASPNTSNVEDPAGFKSTFVQACEHANSGTCDWFNTVFDLFNPWKLQILEEANLSNQTLHYISIYPTDLEGNFVAQIPYTRLYNIQRQVCQGTWPVTRGGIELVAGSCNGMRCRPSSSYRRE